ncbi:MAG TPA: hypothetical protein VMF89_34480, partial [Polyangiales bacterium]|nr:hypothetical protein [Polyangiales bacterium]
MNKSDKRAEPKSIEANLVSLSVLAGALCGLLLLALLVVQQALGGSLQQLQSATLPAQQSVTSIQHAVARLFQRQVQVLSTRTQVELAAYQDRKAIDEEFARSRSHLAEALPRIISPADAQTRSESLDRRTKGLLAEDQALFDSVQRRHEFQETLDKQSATSQTDLAKLIQESRALSGNAHLEYVLALRRVVKTPSPDEVKKLVFGGPRLQQESADQVAAAVLQLGQLVGKIALARTDDELNSISANELSQNLERIRNHLKALISALSADDPSAARAKQLQEQFERTSKNISDASNAQSLLSLRRSVLSEAKKSAE